MANPYYDNTDAGGRFLSGETARGADVDAKFDGVEAGFDRAKIDIDRAVKAPVGETGATELPSVDQRRGRVLAFDAVTGAPIQGPQIEQLGTVSTAVGAIDTVATNIASVNTTATDIANVNTTAANITDVNTVSGSIASVNTVATDIANVNTTAANIAAINDFAATSADVTTVATNIASVNTTATNIASVNTTATNIASVNTTAGGISAVNTVAADLNEVVSEISTVAASIANVDTVGMAIANVNTVATNIGAVNTVATSIANVNTVAGISANVTTVAGISPNVTTVATNIANVNTTAGSIANVDTTATNIASVNTVATNIADVNTTATNIADITAVGANAANINTVAADGVDIGLVATNIASVNTTATNIAAVNTVSTNIADVIIVADNIGNINTVVAELPDISSKVPRTSATGSAIVPAGTEAQRDGTPAAGYLRFNADVPGFEGYDGTEWGSIGGGGVTGGFKNKIIGGDFTTNPWQRGGSFAAIGSGDYAADRWVYNATGSVTAVISVTKTLDSPPPASAGVFTQHCLLVDVTTADTDIAVSALCLIVQRIEGLNAASFGFGQAGTRFVTLSFWHKHTKTGVHCVSLRAASGVRSYVAEYAQDVTNAWEKAIITIPVDTTGAWLYDTGVGIVVSFALAAGTDYQTTADTWQAGSLVVTANQVNNLDSTANDFKIALVQLEAGSATPFETRSVGEELALCQRYYWQRVQSVQGSRFSAFAGALGTTSIQTMLVLPVTMRGSPTVTGSDFVANGLGATPTGVAGTAFNGNSLRFGLTVSGATANNVGNVSFNVTLSAEL